LRTIAEAWRAVRMIRDPSTALALSAQAWNEVLPQLRKARLLSRFAVRAERAGIAERLPPKAREHMQSAMILAQSTRTSLIWESIEVERALARIGVPGILLKGAAFVAADLPAALGRPSSDLDILVPHAALPAVADALREAGWEDSDMDEGERRHFTQWMHQIPAMYHVIRNTAIDIHHAITPVAGLVSVDSAPLFEASYPLSGRHLRVLSPEDMVILAAVHWARSSGLSGSIRDFLDIDDLVRDFSGRDADFHARLQARARRLGVIRTLNQALALAQAFFGTPGPAHAAQPVLARLVLLAGVPSGSGLPNAGQLAARKVLDWRSYRMQMPLNLMLRRSLLSRIEKLGLRRQPTA